MRSNIAFRVLFLTFWFCCVPAIHYSDIVDDSGPEEYVTLTSDDFDRARTMEAVDIKVVIMDALAENGSSQADQVKRFLGNPIQGSTEFEGDILLPPNANIDVGLSDPNYSNRAYNAIVEKRKLWPSGRMPYLISSYFKDYAKAVITSAIEEFHKYTCLRLIPCDRAIHHDFIIMKPRMGCSSFVGRMGGAQYVSLNAGCAEKGIVLHQLMHAFGSFHEQARFDRDQHVTIRWDNIKEEYVHQFQTQNRTVVSTFDTPYDLHSIMHYRFDGYDAFAKNSELPTMTAINGEKLVSPDGLSHNDILKLRTMYDCPPDSDEQPDDTRATETVDKCITSTATTTSTPITPAPAQIVAEIVDCTPMYVKLENCKLDAPIVDTYTNVNFLRCYDACMFNVADGACSGFVTYNVDQTDQTGHCDFFSTIKSSVNQMVNTTDRTLYEKICIDVPSDLRMCFDMFIAQPHKRFSGFERRIFEGVSRAQCLHDCLNANNKFNFKCLSATYQFDLKKCTLNAGYAVDHPEKLEYTKLAMEYIEYRCDDPWKPWGVCFNNVQTRVRDCACFGPLIETRVC